MKNKLHVSLYALMMAGVLSMAVSVYAVAINPVSGIDSSKESVLVYRENGEIDRAKSLADTQFFSGTKAKTFKIEAEYAETLGPEHKYDSEGTVLIDSKIHGYTGTGNAATEASQSVYGGEGNAVVNATTSVYVGKGNR